MTKQQLQRNVRCVICQLSAIVSLSCTPAIESAHALDPDRPSSVAYAGDVKNSRSELIAEQGASSVRTLEVSGVSEKVTLPVRVSLGQGFSRVGGNARGLPFKVVSPDKSTENAVSYDLKYVDSYEELAKALRLDARASFSGFSGGFSASMSLFRAANFSQSKAYAVAKMTSSAPRFPWTLNWGILPLSEGGVHGEIKGRAGPVFLAQEDGRGAARAAWRRSRSGLP